MTSATIREDRDDLGHFCVYDEKFIRRHDDDQPQTHAYCVAGPHWEYDHLRAGPPATVDPMGHRVSVFATK